MTTESNESRPPLTTQVASSDDSLLDHHGSLRSKLVLALAAMFIVFLTIDEFVRQRVIQPEFAALERSAAMRDANRVMASIRSKIEHLSDLAMLLADSLDDPRNPSQRMPQDGDRQDGNRRDKWRSENLEWAALVSADGDWQWLRKRPTRESAEDDDNNLAAIGTRCLQSDTPTLSGMIRVSDNTLVMFAALAIDPPASQQTTQRSGSDRNYLIVGRAIDETILTSLRTQTQVDFSLHSMHNHDPVQQIAVWEADDSVLVVEFQLPGIGNEQLASVFVQIPRNLTAHSSHATSVARNSFIFGAVGALLLLLLLLQRIVIGPLTAIREHSDRVAEHGLQTDPLVLSGNDEIGELASAFDHMVHRLGDAQTQLAEASIAAGRSQVASTVIHNVGNVLTNINSLLDVAAERVDGLRIEPLSKLASRLRQEDSGVAFLDATPDYLEGLAASLDADRDTISQLISTLHDNVRHIHSVIRDQHRHTGHEISPTAFALSDVVNEAIGCCRARLEQESVQVAVTGTLDIDIRSDRSLLLQSMINVIGNARHALRENDNHTRRMSIHAELQQASVVVHFTDNGKGMTPETLQKIFDAHYTTKKTGSGLGLHFCAVTLKRLQGSIQAESGGLGRGSTIVIELPIATSSTSLPVVTMPFDIVADYTVGAES